jgi:hypothetical protein
MLDAARCCPMLIVSCVHSMPAISIHAPDLRWDNAAACSRFSGMRVNGDEKRLALFYHQPSAMVKSRRVDPAPVFCRKR